MAVFLFPRMKPDVAFRRDWRFQHLPKSGEHRVKFGVVALFQFTDFAA